MLNFGIVKTLEKKEEENGKKKKKKKYMEQKKNDVIAMKVRNGNHPKNWIIKQCHTYLQYKKRIGDKKLSTDLEELQVRWLQVDSRLSPNLSPNLSPSSSSNNPRNNVISQTQIETYADIKINESEINKDEENEGMI